MLFETNFVFMLFAPMLFGTKALRKMFRKINLIKQANVSREWQYCVAIQYRPTNKEFLNCQEVINY